MGPDDEFVDYVKARAGRLREVAYLMCGDWHQAQDLTQQTLVKVYLAWRRISARESVDAYARQVLLRELLTERRRRRSTERPQSSFPDAPSRPDHPELRLTLLRALRSLPPNRRAVLVLRYWEDLSVDTVAEIMRITPSAVKSLTVRAVQDLRALVGDDTVLLSP